jgi:hypothetical protein
MAVWTVHVGLHHRLDVSACALLRTALCCVHSWVDCCEAVQCIAAAPRAVCCCVQMCAEWVDMRAVLCCSVLISTTQMIAPAAVCGCVACSAPLSAAWPAQHDGYSTAHYTTVNAVLDQTVGTVCRGVQCCVREARRRAIRPII